MRADGCTCQCVFRLWQLVVALENASKQLYARCADAHPFGYMLDFSREALRFDPSGNYVRRWLPVLSRLPSKYIHKYAYVAPAELPSTTAWFALKVDTPPDCIVKGSLLDHHHGIQIRKHMFLACMFCPPATLPGQPLTPRCSRCRPWDAPPNILNDAGVELGSNYEWPIISMEESRTQVLVRTMQSSPLASFSASLLLPVSG